MAAVAVASAGADRGRWRERPSRRAGRGRRGRRPLAPRLAPSAVPVPPPEVLYEDDEVLAFDKPAGLLSQAAAPGDDSLCARARAHLEAQSSRQSPEQPGEGEIFVGLLHRLDRDVTGACVLAKNREAARQLSAQFAGRTVRKEYIAVSRRWEEGSGATTLRHQLMPNEGRQSQQVARGSAAALSQHAALICRPLCAGPSGVTALLVRLLTGKKHQIRCQLAAVNSALLGDPHYGSGTRDGSGRWIRRPALHSWRLSFMHPKEPHEPCTVVAPLPADLRAVMEATQIDPEEVLAEAERGIDGS